MHRMPGLIALTGILIGSAPLWAETVTERTETAAGITWTYTVNADDGGVTLTGANPASGQLTIPDTLGGLPVTVIGSSALLIKTELTYVSLPNTVTKILSSAFKGCSTLEGVDLPESLKTIGAYAFEKCESLEQIRLPDNLTELQSAAFRGCTNLKQIVIPDGITTISNSLLSGCTNLTTLVLPDTVTEISNYAFMDCSKLNWIDLPESLETIGSNVFENCESLEQIRLPDNLTKLQSAAFKGCVNLKQIVIPDKITKINSSLLSGCTSLTTVVLPASLETIYVTANDNNSHPFYNCPITTLIFRSSGVPTLDRKETYYYIHSYASNNLDCYTDTISIDEWKYIMSGTAANYTLRSLTNGAAIPGVALLDIVTANPGKSIKINLPTAGEATTNEQPLTEGAVACFDEIIGQSASSSAVTVTVTPYAFGISGIRAEANGDVIVTAEVTGISGDADRDGAVKFADGTDVVAVYHTTGADGRSLRQEAGRTRIDGGLSVKDRVEINLAGFLAAGGLGAGEGTHRLTVYATKPIGNTAASGE